MWGSISTEASYQTNFNVGFSNDRSDLLIHLSQWQYWWWFWFVLAWSFYFTMIMRISKDRILKFNPRMNTSFKSRGKWGDFIAAIVPLSWCINILINSNALLRMIEWQNESSLFTIRIRGKQWYWIYKLDLKNFTDILSAPKNVGRNKWQISVFGELQTAEDYLHIMQLRYQNKRIKDYWNESLSKIAKTNKSYLISPQDQVKLNFVNLFKEIQIAEVLSNKYNFKKIASLPSMFTYNKNNKCKNIFINNETSIVSKMLSKKKFFKKSTKSEKILNKFSRFELFDKKFTYFNFNFIIKNKKIVKHEHVIVYNKLFNNLHKNNVYNNINFLQGNLNYDEFNRFLRKSYGVNAPLRFIKYPFHENFEKKGNIELMRLRFNTKPLEIKSKLEHDKFSYFSIKQERYKRKRNIPLWNKKLKDAKGFRTDKNKYSSKQFLKNKLILNEKIKNIDATSNYRIFRRNKFKEKNQVPITLNRRLLRTKRTLVLPSHVNLTAITNSFDVVHSWFIPGLGLKMDCIPGRSTHHSFYIDNAGFYYGQCAEVCGRFHHHMPIRICALPFDHFLLWWHTYGFSRLIKTNHQRKYQTYYTFRKYSW